MTAGSFAEDEGTDVTYTVTGSQTLVGDSENTFTVNWTETTKESNYEVTLVEGTLKITDRPETDKYEITVVANSATEKYDGSEKSVSGFQTLKFTVDNGLEYTVEGLSASATATDAGTYPVKVTGDAVVKDADGNVVTSQFIVKTVNGSLTIQKRNVTLTSATASKEYDGSPLTNNTVTVSGDDFAEGEGATYNVTGSQTIVGFSANTFTYELKAGTKADNYNITKTEGTLTVTNRDAKYEITVVANSATAKYDGSEKSVSGIEDDTFEVNGHTYTVSGVSASASGTNAGTYTANVEGTAVVKDANGNIVTDQFSVKTQAGTLTIQKRNVTLTSGSAVKQYDGTPLTNDEVTVTGDGFVDGEGATYTVTGSQTLVGASANYFTYTLNENTKADNYNITTQNGQLTVTTRGAKYQISVESNSGSFLYDGTAKTVEGFKTLEFTMANGVKYTVDGLSASVTQTDAGTYKIVISGTAIVRDANGNDVSDEFAVTMVPGKMTITPRQVTLTSESGEKVYDGTALTKPEVTVTGDGFVDGEVSDIKATGSITLVGTTPNTIAFAQGPNFKAENYNITKNEGTLKVSELTGVVVTITEPSATVRYDGKEHVLTGYDVSINNPLYTEDDFVFTGDATVRGSAVGVYPMELKASDFTNTNNNFAQVTFVIVDGALTIERRSNTDYYYITATAKSGGSIIPNGVRAVAEGSNVTYKMTPNEGYRVSDVLVDGESVGAVNSYTFEDVHENHTIVVSFLELPTDPDDSGVSDWLNTDDHILYMAGYPDSTFGPDRNITRAEVAQLFYALLLDKDVAITTTFSDVNPNAWYATAVNTMASLGMVTGYPDGTFHPDAPITRAEFVAVALAFAYEPENASCVFSDVSTSSWYYTYVAQATTYGWISGYPDGSFRPDNSITRAEVSVIVNNMLGRNADREYVDEHVDELITFPDVRPSYWAYYSIMETTNTHDYTKHNGLETWK